MRLRTEHGGDVQEETVVAFVVSHTLLTWEKILI